MSASRRTQSIKKQEVVGTLLFLLFAGIAFSIPWLDVNAHALVMPATVVSMFGMFISFYVVLDAQ